jgi:hypothetical protein
MRSLTNIYYTLFSSLSMFCIIILQFLYNIICYRQKLSFDIFHTWVYPFAVFCAKFLRVPASSNTVILFQTNKLYS